jgi:large subunit ribosomal protein L21
MYAIIEHGGHQYRADEKNIIRLQKIDAEPGAAVRFDKVLALRGEDEIKVGAPYVAGAQVTGTVVEQGRGPKIRIFKYKRKKHYKKQAGHRQAFTAVRIEEIAG